MPATPSPSAAAVDIEALADSLSACADALHTRLMRAIRQRQPAGDDALPEGTAQALFENEVALRQRANSLYLDAALLAASGLGGQQQQLLDLTARAQETIRKIGRVKDLIAITAELLQLGAAVASGQPEHIAAPFEKIKHTLEQMRAP